MNATDDTPGLANLSVGPVRLLVVDADRRVRSSLAGLLDLADHVEVVGSAGHARAAFEECESCRPDAVIIDPRLPELHDGIAFIRRLRAEQPGVRVIAIAWAPGTSELLGGDPGIEIVGPDGGELGDRIIEALHSVPRRHDGEPGADARLEATA